MGLAAGAPAGLTPGEDLWAQFIFALVGLEGLCGEQDWPLLLDLRMNDLMHLGEGKLALRRAGGQWWLDVSWQTRLIGLLYLASLLRAGGRAGDDSILPESLRSPAAPGAPLERFAAWLRPATRAAGLPSLSVRGLREAAKLWQLRHRRGYVVAARQGTFGFDPTEPVISLEELRALNGIELPAVDQVLASLGAIGSEGGVSWQPALLSNN